MAGDEPFGGELAGFRILEEIGRGGMGVVYLAEQSSPKRRVALKVLTPELSNDPRFRERFVRESEAAASTEHPNIVPIHASGEVDGSLYIAMRYVEGTDLRALIDAEGALPAHRVAEIVSQIGAALDAAHARGMVHRDVKPGNILLDTHGNAYLTDFGLIKRNEVSTGITRTGQFMGSIDYCAPEQIRGDPVDARVDVYSLGCVLYECMAGRPPFPRETDVAVLYAHLEEPPPTIVTSGGGPRSPVDEVVATAMAKRPADRYASAGELARAARHALGVISGEREAVRRPRRGIGVVAVAIAVSLLAVLGLALLFVGGGGEGGSAGSGAPSGATEAGDDSAVQVDAGTGKILQTVGGFSVPFTGAENPGFVAGEGAVWVWSQPRILHLDPLNGSVRGSTLIPQSFGSAIAVGFRTVWLSVGAPRLVLERINPATDELLRPIELSSEPLAGAQTVIAVGEGSVWVGVGNQVFQVDPAGARLVRSIEVGGADGIAVGLGSVWTIDNLSAELERIDPATGKVTGTAELPGSLDGVAAGADTVWVLDRDAGAIYRVDPETLALLGTVRVGTDESGIVFGDGAVWLADGREASVTRMDPVTSRLASFSVGGPAALVSIDPDSGQIWVLRASAD